VIGKELRKSLVWSFGVRKSISGSMEHESNKLKLFFNSTILSGYRNNL
jgi:hypothetical protein